VAAITLGVKGIPFFINGLLVIIIAFLFKRLAQYLLDFKQKPLAVLFISASLVITLSLLYVLFWKLNNNVLVLSLLIPFLFTVGYAAEQNIIEKSGKIITSTATGKKRNIYMQMLLNRKSVRLALLIGFGLKIIFIGFILFTFIKREKLLLDDQYFFWLFATPLIVYTYIFNNAWGFFKNIWFSLEIASGDYKEMMRECLKLQFFPLIIDAIITIPLLLFIVEDKLFAILFYSSTFIALAAGSLIWSILFPVVVNISVFKRSSTSFISSIFSIVIVLGLAAMQYNTWLYLLAPLVIFISWLVFTNAPVLYKSKKYQLAEKLLKE